MRMPVVGESIYVMMPIIEARVPKALKAVHILQNLGYLIVAGECVRAESVCVACKCVKLACIIDEGENVASRVLMYL